MNERQMILVDKSVKEKDWRLTLDYTEKYLQKKRTNQLIVYFHNLALYHTGQLPYHLFDFPQKLGVKGLYLPWNSDSRESEYGYHIYDNLGYINEAQRWETEAMVVWGETPSHLINLSKYSIMNGSPLIAQRFINLLKQSLYYKKEAIKIEKETKSRNFSKQETSHFINITNIGPNLLHICKQDSTNQMAFEYLMADLLLSNNVIRFAENLKFIKNFKYPKMPTNYEEALYIYKLGVDQSTFSKLGFKISEETEERFKRYYTLYKQQNLSELQNEFGNSYWYYLNFISPYGDKIIKN